MAAQPGGGRPTTGLRKKTVDRFLSMDDLCIEDPSLHKASFGVFVSAKLHPSVKDLRSVGVFVSII